jgi:hypothetical protein
MGQEHLGMLELGMRAGPVSIAEGEQLSVRTRTSPISDRGRSRGRGTFIRGGGDTTPEPIESEPILLSQRGRARAKRLVVARDLRMANPVEEAPEVLVALDGHQLAGGGARDERVLDEVQRTPVVDREVAPQLCAARGTATASPSGCARASCDDACECPGRRLAPFTVSTIAPDGDFELRGVTPLPSPP